MTEKWYISGTVMKKFSKTFLESLTPQAKTFTHTCEQIPGLGIAVHPTGTKTFFYRRRTNEFDTGRLPIGRWPMNWPAAA